MSFVKRLNFSSALTAVSWAFDYKGIPWLAKKSRHPKVFFPVKKGEIICPCKNCSIEFIVSFSIIGSYHNYQRQQHRLCCQPCLFIQQTELLKIIIRLELHVVLSISRILDLMKKQNNHKSAKLFTVLLKWPLVIRSVWISNNYNY